ncbi:hypothetical protein SD427_00870 [Chryseobacterium sp. JJR-5R]|uniref:hypothetical protein n=1 Tax=Chryseobacterium sp. JJR-5R TaxID=3093923 RepID=UPI002A760430|nr:hypothetical protein [Chryseobacterium sp. JJR-5R]WPO82924.1 hypothetical protein SD427_00870 [Chryseobacterium sp. JJR-5R]
MELLKSPKNIQSEDLSLLEEEIDSFPYIQNIRALYLYGVHRYDKENYQKVLSTTAAYTTDKKILYQLINGKIQQRPKPEVVSEAITEKPAPEEKVLKPLQQRKISGFPLKREDAPVNENIPENIEPAEDIVEVKEQQRILPEPRPEIKHVYVNGEKNRILFEGEENFMEDEDIETIDLESTLESGSIVTQKPRKAEIPVAVEGEGESESQTEEKDRQIKDPGYGNPEEFTSETIIEEEKITAEPEEEVIPDEPKLNFHETEALVPEVQVQDNESRETQEPDSVEEHAESSTDINKQAEEFTPETIIEEEKITAEPEKEEVIFDESELSFHETEAFIPEVEVQDNESRETQEPDSVEEHAESSTDINKPAEEFTPETIIEEEKITAEPEKEEVILNESELSFHETEAFIPEVEVQNNEPKDIQETGTADNQDYVEDPDTAQQTGFTSEKVIDEDEISSEKEKEAVQDDAELSFHGTESFMPEVKIQANNTEENSTAEIIQPNTNKHEDEMRRLIEKVEKRMKEKVASDAVKKEEKEKEPENLGSDISFAETQSFEMQPSEPERREENKEDIVSADETQPAVAEEVKEVDQEKEIIATEESAEIKSAWKPMSFESNLPDSLLSKSAETPRPKPETAAEETKTEEEKPVQEEVLPAADEPVKETLEDTTTDEQINDGKVKTETENKEEAPVMNVSFFGSGWSIAQPEKNQKETEEQSSYKVQEEKAEGAPVNVTVPNPADSNVPGFINTWQSWLKIDRAEEVEKEKVEVKTKVIEAFIENNPRISQLKDEVNFVVKEKGDDISHLMTETLAKLYVEQKLYTKAIKAFEILIGKIPEKEDYFRDKIQEIKDFRNK